jgi:hypothetical protein
MGALLRRTGRPLGACVQRSHSCERVFTGGKRVYTSGRRSLEGHSLATEAEAPRNWPLLAAPAILSPVLFFEPPTAVAPTRGGGALRDRPIDNRPQVTNLPHEGLRNLLASVNAALKGPESAQSARADETP